MKHLLLIFHLAFMILTVDYLPLMAEEKKSETTVKIGAIFGFTGFANVWSEQARRGIDMAVDEANREGGINGKKVEVIYEDSQSTPAGGVSAFNKLVNNKRVRIVVGDIISFITLPLVPLAQREQVLLVTPSIFDTDLPTNSEFFYTTCPTKNSIREPVDRFFSINKDVRSVAILCANNSWGLTYLDVWQDIAKRHGVEVLDVNCVDDYSTDMRMEILRAKSKNPDAVIIAFAIDRALQRMNELNFHPKVLSTNDVAEAIRARGLHAKVAEGVFFNDWLTSDEFQSNFKERYKEPPIMEPQNSYEAMRSVIRAARNNLSKPDLGMNSVNYEGVSGPINFSKSHAGNLAPATLMVVKDGKIAPVGKAISNSDK